MLLISPASPSPAATARARQPELLGIRAPTVALVVLGHWTLPAFPYSEVGRMTLLVLSAYLITGLIWQHDIYWGRPGSGRRLGAFYMRRFLRIVPPYYLALALSALLPLALLHQYPAWFLLLVPNHLCFKLRAWPEGLGHYWTLGVEEQFYLLWPLALTWLPRRTGWLWGMAALGVAFRLWTVLHLPPAAAKFSLVLLPACFDLLAAGALLRLHLARRPPGPRRPWPGWPGLLASLLWAATWAGLDGSPVGRLGWYVVSPSLGALAAYLTLRWLLGAPRGGRWLARPAAQWLGRRSYGLYLYHPLLAVFYQRLVYYLLPDAAARAWWLAPLPTVLVLAPVLLGLSAASWRWLEAPLERLKERFAYQEQGKRVRG